MFRMKKITIEKFIQLREIKETEDEIKNVVKMLSIIYDKPESYFMKLKYGKLNKYTKPLEKLDIDKVKASNRKWFIHNGCIYDRKDYQDLTNNEMVSINSILDSKMNEGVKIMKVLEILYKPFYKSRFTVDDKFKGLDIQKAYSHIIFFFDGGKNYYLKLLVACSEGLKKIKTNQVTKEIVSAVQNVNSLIQYLRNGNGMSLSQYLEKEMRQNGKEQVS